MSANLTATKTADLKSVTLADIKQKFDQVVSPTFLTAPIHTARMRLYFYQNTNNDGQSILFQDLV